MTLRHIEIFAMVCREGSITRAAEKLYLSQPTVSVAIREMEEHYGNALFERISRKLYLTPFGHRIYDYSLGLLKIYSDMSGAKQDYDIIRVCTGTAVGKLFLPGIVKSFMTAHPDVHVHVAVGDATRMYSLLMQNNADFVFAETVDEIYGLAHRSIQRYPIVALCHRDNPLAKKAEVTAEDLAGQNLLLREPDAETRRIVDRFFLSRSVDVSPAWESYSVQTLLNATRENIGVSFHSLDHAVAYRDENLVILNVPGLGGYRYVNMSYHRDKVFSPNMQAFIDYYLAQTEEMLTQGLEAYNRMHPEAPYNAAGLKTTL